MSIINIKLTEDQVLAIRHVDVDEWRRAFKNALDTNRPIDVHDPDGRTLAINPHQILFWEEVPEKQDDRQAQAA